MEDTQNISPDAGADEAAAKNESAAGASAAAEPTELEKAQALAAENKAGWQRAIADYANLKREMERTTADLSKYAVAGFIGKLLPVVDSYRKATEQKPWIEGQQLDEARAKQWIEGALLIRGQFENVLSSAGVQPIDTADVPFDANLHEAMMMQPAPEGKASGTVLQILEPGYLLHERVIRPAKVIVAE